MDVNFLDPNYLPWLIPVPPLVAFALIILGLGRYKTASHLVALGGVLLSWVMSWGIFSHVVNEIPDFGPAVLTSSIDWMNLGTGEPFQMGVLVDPLTAVMLFMVPLAMVMIFVYSVGYMNAYPQDDPHQLRHTRFFAYLSLFAGAMLTLVVADNLLLLFMAWEVMGLCSYLLIGFLFEKKSAYQAAVKAFMTTRVADVLFIVGIGYLYAETGTLSFRAIVYNPELLHMLGDTNAPILGMSIASLAGVLIVAGTIGKSAQFPLHVWLPDAMEGPTPVSAMIHAAAMVSAGVYLVIRMYPLLAAGGDPHHGEYTDPLILMGVLGSFTALGAAFLGVGQNDVKRVLAYSTISQLGFMVAALGIGAYIAAAFHLITHAFFKALLFMSSGAVIHAMEHGEHHVHAHHGHGNGHGHDDHALTSGHEHAESAHEHADVHAAHDHAPDHDHDAHGLALHDGGHYVQSAAYGQMHAFEGEPLPEWNTGMTPDGIQLDYVATPNDMRLMGGLFWRIPVTAISFLIGGLSLAGFPLITAGFWSKDEILADAWIVGTNDGIYWLHLLVFVCLALAAVLTAFYTGRQWLLTFWGQPRSEIAEHATLVSGGIDEEAFYRVPFFMRWLAVLTDDSVVAPELRGKNPLTKFFTVYRDSFPMQLPLVILAFFALTAGWVGVHPDFPIVNIFTGGNNFFKDFIKYTLAEETESIEFALIPVLTSFTVSLLGLALAWVLYGSNPLREGQEDPMEGRLGSTTWKSIGNRFDFDNAILRTLYVPFEWFGRVFTYRQVDKETIDPAIGGVGDGFVWLGEAIKRFNYVVIDGVGDGIPKLVMAFGRWFRNMQSGRVQQYMLFFAVALIAMGVLLILQAL